ncbi:uncharacterized protein LOC115881694 [Sitophilus oryzae]|uniref:Uncharacterized protein LOC115881694 n=1 Tax=Sitophilus oryzae TaxID=7048 RepID=A0A6J2XWL4_SITOR|nr:uncharacterized protein LOC115881694 [Sitophilus oryzae]
MGINAMKRSVIFIGLVLCVIRCSASTTCDDTEEDLHFPHPTDCARYYRCVYGRKVLKICPEKMLFNPAIANCDLYYNVDCRNENKNSDEDFTEVIENLTRKIPSRIFSTSTEKGVSNSEEIILNNSDSNIKFVYLPHEEDSSRYYKFESGEKFLMNCDEGMYFNFELEICIEYE